MTTLCSFQEYETARKELEGVKKSREDAKKQLKTVRESQAPMLKKIQHIDSQLRPIENQMKDKVRDWLPGLCSWAGWREREVHLAPGSQLMPFETGPWGKHVLYLLGG